MRVLGLDYGEKRIGVALSDPLGLSAQPHPFIPNDDQKWARIQEKLTEYEIQTIVVGLPKNRDGGETEKSQEVRAFAQELETKLGVSIVFWDERFSTVAAQKHLISANLRREQRKMVIDSQAACFILQGYMDRMKNQPC